MIGIAEKKIERIMRNHLEEITGWENRPALDLYPGMAVGIDHDL
jgi:hypothetical protein|tara:strand:- start:4 stop:135 length:132 start_codon:yes stop_codon:yes gene_type:complete